MQQQFIKEWKNAKCHCANTHDVTLLIQFNKPATIWRSLWEACTRTILILLHGIVPNWLWRGWIHYMHRMQPLPHTSTYTKNTTKNYSNQQHHVAHHLSTALHMVMCSWINIMHKQINVSELNLEKHNDNMAALIMFCWIGITKKNIYSLIVIE